jgi:NhaP-type Na+/H+ or K+/H+ antiporter
MGPYGAGVFDPRGWASDTREITLEVTRVVLGIGLFAIGVELPKAYMGQHIPGLVTLVVPTMAIGWIVVAGACAPQSLQRLFFLHIPLGFMLVLFPSLSFISCLVIAACLTPTDPVISAAIVGKCFRFRPTTGGH